MTKIAVIASDNYVDAVPLCFKALDKYWPTCKMRRELVYCQTPPDFHDLNVPLNGIVRLGEDQGWIKNVMRYIYAFGHDQPILLLLEDYLLCDSNDNLMAIADAAIQDSSVAMVRVRATPGPTLPWTVEGLGEIDKQTNYSVSLQASIWQPGALMKILKAVFAAGGRSAWDFELKGSKLVPDLDIGHFLGLEESGIAYKNLYRRGEKVPNVVKWAEENL